MKINILILSVCLIAITKIGQAQQNITISSDSEDTIKISLTSDIKSYTESTHETLSVDQILLLKKIGNNFQRLNNYDSAIYYYKIGAAKALEMEQHKYYSSIIYNLSLAYLSKGEYQYALNNALIALEKDKESNAIENIASSLNSVALIYQEWGIYDKALEYRLQSIKLSEDNSNLIEIANGYYNLGNLYRKLDKPEKALSYFLQARDKYTILLKANPNSLEYNQGLSESIYSIAGIYLYNKEYPKSLELLNDALKLKNSLNDKVGIGNCYNQIGLINYLLNEYPAAKQNYFLSLQYKHLVNDQKGIALIYYRIGRLYFSWSKVEQSETFILKSLDVASQINDREILGENYRILYQIYSDKKRYKEALMYHEKHMAYTDTLLNANTTKIVEELNISYETDKKEKENVILLRENDIKALTIQKQKSVGRYLVGLIALAVIIVITLYILYRSKRKTNNIISFKNTLLKTQNDKIAQQKRLIEIKNENLTDSITYAKRIQDAMLVDVNKISSYLNDAFILFKPKDIVSGDFYWSSQKDGKFIISAIDCTGHGVPGAFMSMLGNSLLNQIVLDQGITSPELILQELSKEVQNTLKQSETNNNDGMDMSLCTVDLTNKQLEFSGAKNPLIYIEDGKLHKIKGDKMPIGISHFKDYNFGKHKLNATKRTCFYLFSDGYADQFGGDNGKKFMTKRFYQLLLDIHKAPMSEQKEILNNTINEWMKNEEQVDDILVMGFIV